MLPNEVEKQWEAPSSSQLQRDDVLQQQMKTTALISFEFPFFPLGSSEAKCEGRGRLMAFPVLLPKNTFPLPFGC